MTNFDYQTISDEVFVTSPIVSNSAPSSPANPIDQLSRQCSKFNSGLFQIDPDSHGKFDLVASLMHAVNYEITRALGAGAGRDQILQAIDPVRRIQGASPFVKRLQTWPRGYQGDFETVEYLMEAVNLAETETGAYWIEQYCLNTAIAQQHRNKVRWQSEHVERVIRAREASGQPARILILACGSSPDTRLVLERIVDKDFRIVLSDMDDAALEFSAQKLAALGDRVMTMPGNIFRQINKFSAEGPFDLVLAGGLFDYLKDDQAMFLVRSVTSKLLAPNGKFAFTNIAKPNPYKIWMEYCANWFLTERSRSDCIALVNGNGNISIERDNSGLSYLIEVDR
ncbi:MAG: class I SAM-dependent methyltransferase [Pyrinomonadaceae bacterium]